MSRSFSRHRRFFLHSAFRLRLSLFFELPITLIINRLLATLEHVQRCNVVDCRMQSLNVVMLHEVADRPLRIVDRERRRRTSTLTFDRPMIAFNRNIALRIEQAGADVRHPGDLDEMPEACTEEPRSNANSVVPSDWPLLSLETAESTGLARGWISGLISAVLGLSALRAVICFHVPGLTVQQVCGYYPVELIRWLLHAFMVGLFFQGMTSLWLRRNKTMGLIGIGSTLIAAKLGGSTVEINGDVRDTWLGLDWVVINVRLY